MTKKHTTCTIAGCHGKHRSRGLCTKHYNRQKRVGTATLRGDLAAAEAQQMLRMPMSARQLANAVKVSEPYARRIIRNLGAHLVFHVGVAGDARTETAYYSLQRVETTAAWSAIAKAMKARQESLSYSEIADLIGMAGTAVRRHIANMHEAKFVHIARWSLSARIYERMWKFGPGVDAPKPRAKTSKEKHRIRQVRLQVDPELAMRAENRQKARDLKPYRDPLVAALFGDAR